MVTGIIILAIGVLLFLYGVNLYNNLVNLKHNVSKAWSNIDVLLKQRHDELPKLVEVCKQYMKHERETLEKVIAARKQVQDARSAGDVGALGAAEANLRLGLGSLFAVAEAYPDLKADETFRHLQGRISSLENSIADRREFYNESVNQNNIQIDQFPDLILARLLNFKPAELLEFREAELRDPNLKTLFQG